MKKQSSLVLMSIAITAATILAACGSGGGGGEDPQPIDNMPPTAAVQLPYGPVLTVSSSISILFSEPMKLDSLVLRGTMASESDGGTWSSTAVPNDTLIINPALTWSASSERTLIIDATDVAGNPLSSVQLALHVVHSVVHVRALADGGDDASPGTAEQPKASIPSAIAAAQTQGHPTAAVLVAAGTYAVSSSSIPPTHVVIADGISLYGGYAPGDWSVRNPNLHATVVTETSSSGVFIYQAIWSGGNVTTATIIDGFTLVGGSANFSAAIKNDGGSPTLQNNVLLGGRGSNTSAAVFNVNGASPVIRRNRIDGGGAVGADSYGIYAGVGASPVIYNNLISGGDGAMSFGIYNLNSSSSVIRNNTIDGGRAGLYSYGIYSSSDSHPVIENNIVFTSSGSMGRVCVSEGDDTGDPATLRSNDLFGCPTALFMAFVGGGTGNCLFNNFACYLDLADVNDAAKTTHGEAASSTGNISSDPLFADPDGADDSIATMADNDWHLTASSPLSVTQGGLDFSAQFTTDKDGAARTAPWSMGAYERD